MKTQQNQFEIINGINIYLRRINISDANEKYLKWMNDKEVTKFLENKIEPYSMDQLKKYIINVLNNKYSHFFAIIIKSNNNHIGNVKLEISTEENPTAYLGLIIGEKNSWGKGYATETFRLITDFGFTKLNLEKISAGCYKDNLGSIKALEKAGYRYDEQETKKFFKEKLDEFIILSNKRKK